MGKNWFPDSLLNRSSGTQLTIGQLPITYKEILSECMKRLKKDIKGMTLIEVVVSLLIISTASLIMVQGFVTVNRLFYESNQYNETTANVRAALIPDENGDVEDNEKVKVKTGQEYIYCGSPDILFLDHIFRKK